MKSASNGCGFLLAESHPYLEPMTLIYNLDLGIINLHTKNEVSRHGFQKSEHKQETHTHTDRCN